VESFLYVKCKIRLILLDPLLYFDPKQLFHNISIITVQIAGQLVNSHSDLFYLRADESIIAHLKVL
jgi:hypothetical protein